MCFLYFCLQGQYEDCIEFETHVSLVIVYLYLLERFSLDCRKTKTKVNTLANQRA